MKWVPTMSVGVDVIDNQHKKLIYLVNRFGAEMDDLLGLDCLTDKSKRVKIYMIIMGLRSYFLEHFSTEERYMLRSRYPGFLEHKREHDVFIRKVFDFEAMFLDGKLSIAREMYDFLKTWIRHHTVHTDGKYIPHFSSRFSKDAAAPSPEEAVEGAPGAGDDPLAGDAVAEPEPAVAEPEPTGIDQAADDGDSGKIDDPAWNTRLESKTAASGPEADSENGQDSDEAEDDLTEDAWKGRMNE